MLLIHILACSESRDEALRERRGVLQIFSITREQPKTRSGEVRMHARPELSIVQNPACYVRASANSSRSIYGIDRSVGLTVVKRRRAIFGNARDIWPRCEPANPPPENGMPVSVPRCDRVAKLVGLWLDNGCRSLCRVQHRGIRQNVESAVPPRRAHGRNLRQTSISRSRRARFTLSSIREKYNEMMFSTITNVLPCPCLSFPAVPGIICVFN